MNDFDNIWQKLPFNHLAKERLKNVIFTCLPFFFKKNKAFNNWKHAQIFKDKTFSFWTFLFWKRFLSKSYFLNISDKECNLPLIKSYSSLAIAIHAYYPDLFQEILYRIENVDNKKIKLYITTPINSSKIIERILKKSSLSFKILEVENRGRDILPFLKLLPVIFEDGYELVLKIHTKKANHLDRKENWQHDLFNKLIGEGAIKKTINIFENNPSIGIVGPVKHILPMHYYYGSNALNVIDLCQKMNIEISRLSNLNFVAGSMFYATKEALMPIVKLGLNEENFEIENGQIDGTLAHAIERVFSAALLTNNLQLADTEYNKNNPVLLISKTHYFTI